MFSTWFGKLVHVSSSVHESTHQIEFGVARKSRHVNQSRIVGALPTRFDLGHVIFAFQSHSVKLFSVFVSHLLGSSRSCECWPCPPSCPYSTWPATAWSDTRTESPGLPKNIQTRCPRELGIFRALLDRFWPETLALALRFRTQESPTCEEPESWPPRPNSTWISILESQSRWSSLAKVTTSHNQHNLLPTSNTFRNFGLDRQRRDCKRFVRQRNFAQTKQHRPWFCVRAVVCFHANVQTRTYGAVGRMVHKACHKQSDRQENNTAKEKKPSTQSILIDIMLGNEFLSVVRDCVISLLYPFSASTISASSLWSRFKNNETKQTVCHTSDNVTLPTFRILM